MFYQPTQSAIDLVDARRNVPPLPGTAAEVRLAQVERDRAASYAAFYDNDRFNRGLAYAEANLRKVTAWAALPWEHRACYRDGGVLHCRTMDEAMHVEYPPR